MTSGGVGTSYRRHRATPGDEILATTSDGPRWVFPGLLRTGVTLFYSEAKLGKSNLCSLMARAVVDRGFAFLGERAQGRGEALVLFLEESREDVKRRMVDHGYTPAVVRHIGYKTADDWGPIDPNDRWDLDSRFQAVEGMLGAWQYLNECPQLLVVDTLGEFCGGEVRFNDYGATTPVMSRFKKLAVEWDLAVVLTHHSHKGSRDNPLGNIVNDSLGSVRIPASADVVWGLCEEEAGSETYALKSKGRGLSYREVRLAKVEDTKDWRVLRPWEELPGLRGAIVDMLRGREATAQEVAEALLKGDRTRISREMAAMARSGILRKKREGVRMLYSVPEDGPG